MKGDKPTVLIVDDDPKILASLQRLLELSDYSVRTFTSSSEILGSPLPEGPCCAVIDLQMPKVTGLQLHSLLMKRRPGLPVIFVSGYGDIPKAVHAMRAGAADFLVKPIEEQKLLDVIKRALVQEQQFRIDRDERMTCRNRFNSLTMREREVCGLVARGKLNKQIAAELGISEKTVKVHRGRVMKKMDVQSVAELVRVVVKLDATAQAALKGLVPTESAGSAKVFAVRNHRARIVT